MRIRSAGRGKTAGRQCVRFISRACEYGPLRSCSNFGLSTSKSADARVG